MKHQHMVKSKKNAKSLHPSMQYIVKVLKIQRIFNADI